jgi:hypothetical protein
VDGGAAPDLPARGRRVSERPAGCGVGVAGANDPAGKRSDDMKGFVILPRRWVVERTFSRFGRNRRLAKDFENLAETWPPSSPSPPSSLASGGLPGSRSISADRVAPVPLPAAYGCCGFGEGTFASTHGERARCADSSQLSINRVSAALDPSRSLSFAFGTALHAPFRSLPEARSRRMRSCV